MPNLRPQVEGSNHSKQKNLSPHRDCAQSFYVHFQCIMKFDHPSPPVSRERLPCTPALPPEKGCGAVNTVRCLFGGRGSPPSAVNARKAPASPLGHGSAGRLSVAACDKKGFRPSPRLPQKTVTRIKGSGTESPCPIKISIYFAVGYINPHRDVSPDNASCPKTR